jgi:hypothetical protein
LSALIQQAKLLSSCLPPYVTHWGHFDLHFANIFLDLESNNFILIDPRGYEYCDFYYDLGKLWHSVNGKYDFVAERRFTLSGREFEIEKNGVYFEYEKIRGELPSLFTKYSKESREDVMRKVEFAEAMHFSSLMPFFFDYDKREYRAIAAYYTGVMLLNEFNEKYLKDYAETDWININYPKDWKLAGEKEWRLI